MLRLVRLSVGFGLAQSGIYIALLIVMRLRFIVNVGYANIVVIYGLSVGGMR
jgi:hypothetical protein